MAALLAGDCEEFLARLTSVARPPLPTLAVAPAARGGALGRRVGRRAPTGLSRVNATPELWGAAAA